MSGELWLGEGFTQYYGPLTLSRAGLATCADHRRRLPAWCDSVALNPAAHGAHRPRR